jgi:predicted nucleic acid-binding Zn finger protein
MSLYTIMPEELIFPTDEKLYANQHVIEMNGISMMVEKNEDQYRIIRLLSTDPQDFLTEEYCPGKMISINQGILRV